MAYNGRTMEPRIQYAQTADGVSIAFWMLGEGVPLVGMHAQSLRHYKGLCPVRRAELQSYRDRMLPVVPEGEEERE